jgi:glucose-6-phosphate 1-dehydrogenase
MLCKRYDFVCTHTHTQRKAEVRIQFKRPPGTLFEHVEGFNELVLRVQPNEAVYLKTIAKTPGLSAATEQAELDLTYKSRFNVVCCVRRYVVLCCVMLCDRALSCNLTCCDV